MPGRFPIEAVLRDGRRVLIRPFAAGDTDELFEFFQRLPAQVRRLAWDNVADKSVIAEWGRNIDYGKVFPLLATDGHQIVADATLHRRSRGPLRLVGRLKWMVDPAFRGFGLGTTLVNNLITIAKEQGLRHVSCMLIVDYEADAIQTLGDLGFQPYLMPGYGADPDGKRYDMIKMVLPLG